MATIDVPLLTPETSYTGGVAAEGGRDVNYRYRSVLQFPSAHRDDMGLKSDRTSYQGNISTFSVRSEERERDADSLGPGAQSLPPEYRTVYSART